MSFGINYYYNMGSLLGLCLIIQITSGVLLSMFYLNNIEEAFNSVERIMREVALSGHLLRNVHAVGATLFFLVMYIHMARGFYYGSYMKPRTRLWIIGVIIMLLMVITAFLGYSLPFGQQSYWAVTVITNLMSALPYVGQDLVIYIWGSFSVSQWTLTRFFSLHYLLPFVIAALVGAHILSLHEHGSSNPLGINSNSTLVNFHPYYTYKDIFGYFVYFFIFMIIVYYFPAGPLGQDPDNSNKANPLVTPAAIVPHIYLLPFYAILRSVPNKLGGVIAMVGAILIVMFLPLCSTSFIRSSMGPLPKFLVNLFFCNFLLLVFIGSVPVEQPFIFIGQLASLLYFAFFLIVLPIAGLIQNNLVFGQPI